MSRHKKIKVIIPCDDVHSRFEVYVLMMIVPKEK